VWNRVEEVVQPAAIRHKRWGSRRGRKNRRAVGDCLTIVRAEPTTFYQQPRTENSLRHSPGGVGSPAVQKPRPTVLIIDDEPLVRRVTRRALEAEVSVLEAADGEEGLALLDRPETTIDLVVTDFMMPKINGLGVIAVLARYRPELPVIGMTGHTDPALREIAAKYGVRVLQKPFDISLIVTSVRQLLAANGGNGVGKHRQTRKETTPRRRARGLVAAAKALVLPIKVCGPGECR